MSDETSTPGAESPIGAVIAENKTLAAHNDELSARCADLEADNSRLGLIIKKLEGQIVDVTAERDLWAAKAATVSDFATAPIAAEPEDPGTRDGRCTALGRHVSACGCMGAMREPIAHVKQRSHDDH
jgi:hypothetical protein